MLYIQVDVTLIDHPKTKKLARLLGVSRMTTVGHLVALWSWAAQYATDGDLSDYREEPDVIADGAQWDGDPAQFVNALINARIGTGHGFLEDHVDGSLLLHDWHEYFGRLIERRRQDAERKRQERRETSEDAQEDVQWTSAGHPQDAPRKSSVNAAQHNAAQLSEAQPNEESERGATFTPGPVVARASVTRTVGTKPNPKLSPAVNAFAQVTGKFPPRGIHHLIEAAMEARDDPELLRRCYETWLTRGYRPENIAWLQEWYTAGAIPSQTRNGNGKSPETPAADY